MKIVFRNVFRWLLLPSRRRAVLRIAVAVALAAASPVSAESGEAAWQALRNGGHVVLMRHALAPGTGDPAGFVPSDCATQRNLSAEGRDQAREAGARLKAQGIAVDRVLSSRWCRCLETAEALGLGAVEPFAPLDSFFGTPGDGPARTAAVMAFLRGLGNRTVVMVTHQVNITALTGIYPRSGEAIVARPDGSDRGGLIVVGRIAPAERPLSEPSSQ